MTRPIGITTTGGQRARVRQVLEAGPLTGDQISALTGIARQVVGHHLRELAARGRVVSRAADGAKITVWARVDGESR